MDLAAVYEQTRSYPADERFGLVMQLRKAAISVSSNIAEGNGRGTTKDYVRFLMVSKGSLNEVRSQLAVSTRLGFVTANDIQSLERLCDRIGRMLMGLRKSLTKNKAKKRTALRRRPAADSR